MKNKKAQGGMVGLLVMIFIVAIVGTALIPSVAQSSDTAENSAGIDGTASETLLNLNTLMYAILIMGSVAGLSFLLMRYVGLV